MGGPGSNLESQGKARVGPVAGKRSCRRGPCAHPDGATCYKPWPEGMRQWTVQGGAPSLCGRCRSEGVQRTSGLASGNLLNFFLSYVGPGVTRARHREPEGCGEQRTSFCCLAARASDSLAGFWDFGTLQVQSLKGGGLREELKRIQMPWQIKGRASWEPKNWPVSFGSQDLSVLLSP